MSPAPAVLARPDGRPGLMASMLTADFAQLGEQCVRLATAGVDGIHWDIMDGVAVPSLSFGPDVVAACRPAVSLPFEAHVMSEHPERFVAALAEAGCASLTIHPDWVRDPRRVLQAIRDAGMVAGVALSPGTPVEFAQWHLDVIGLILVLTVEPGYGGQPHLPAMAGKVAQIAALADRAGHPVTVEVDGGIAGDTIAAMHRAGAQRFVVGSALWRAESFGAAIADLHAACGGADAKTGDASRTGAMADADR